jgi:hypothetical protein
MSYTRNYREQIAVPYSGTVKYTYPASKDGGSSSVNYSGMAYEDVDVNINVDTNAFDNSVEHCNTNVNLLTGAVVATESAQIASIDKNSKKVAATIIKGFFGYIRSEISQQIAKLTQGIDSQLMHLKELSKAVVDKNRQMEGDFMRISSRYIKIFDDLNNELENRIFLLDKPTFLFKKELDNQDLRSTKNDLVNTVTVFGKEGIELQSKICVSIAKKRALDTLNKSKVFLWQQKKLNNTIQRSMLNESVDSSQYIPVCFIETQADNFQIMKELFVSSFISTMQESKAKNDLIEHFLGSSNSWSEVSTDYSNKLKLHFNSELNKLYNKGNEHSVRVKDMIQKISNLSSIQTISLQNLQK